MQEDVEKKKKVIIAAGSEKICSDIDLSGFYKPITKALSDKRNQQKIRLI